MKTTAQEKKQKLEIARQKAQAWAIKQKIKSKKKKFKTENQIRTKKIPQEKIESAFSEDLKFKPVRKPNQAHSETLEKTLLNLTRQRDSLNKSIILIKERLREVKEEESIDQPL